MYKFDNELFDDNYVLGVTSGFNDPDLNGYPYMCGATFNGNDFKGIFVMIFKDLEAGATIRKLFYPVKSSGYHYLYGLVINANGTFEINKNIGWNFSNNSRMTSDGYFKGISSAAHPGFSYDDGVWGFTFDGNADRWLLLIFFWD